MKNTSFRSRLAAIALACSLPLLAQAQAYEFPNYADGAQVKAACDVVLLDLKNAETKLAQSSGLTTAALLTEFDAINRRVEDTLGPMWLMIAVHPKKEIREASEACSRDFQSQFTKLQRNPNLYALLKAAVPADAIDTRYRQDLLDAFEDSGVGLTEDKQIRAQQISEEIVKLGQEFSRRIREDKTTTAYTEAELEGVPRDVWKDAKRDEQGRILLGLAYPVSGPVMQNAVNAATRERMWRATSSKGGADNLPTLAKLIELRREYAALFGFDSYADFTLRRRMAGREANALQFLDTVKQAVAKRELTDIDLLRQSKARHLKQPFKSTTIERWDVAFYTERARRERYSVDQEQFRPYFPAEASLDFVFRISTKLFNVRFTPTTQTLWHPDARVFEIADVATGKTVGTLFVDLYPREDKYTHAAVWSFRNVSTQVGRLPAAGLVVNFNRKGLTLDELETLLHELGHALHSQLSSTRYADQGGTAVPRDFVEAPSQMLEDWVYDDGVQALFKEVCASCKPVPARLLAKTRQAKHFGKGLFTSRQHLFASYDLSLYGREKREPLPEWARMEGATPLGHVPGSMFPAGFDHIAGGYAAGYYGYLWSLVIAEDLRTAFDGRKLDATVGARYRSIVLANGGQVAPNEMLQQFLGRPTNSKAFFKSLARK